MKKGSGKHGDLPNQYKNKEMMISPRKSNIQEEEIRARTFKLSLREIRKIRDLVSSTPRRNKDKNRFNCKEMRKIEGMVNSKNLMKKTGFLSLRSKLKGSIILN